MSSFFKPRRSSETASSNAPPVVAVRVPAELPPTWKKMIRPLTPNSSSWVIHLPRFCPPPSKQTFLEFWEKRPSERHSLVLCGKSVMENRHSQMYLVTQGSAAATAAESQSDNDNDRNNDNNVATREKTKNHCSYHYTYSGSSRLCLPCDPSKRDEKFMIDLCSAADRIVTTLLTNEEENPKLEAVSSGKQPSYNDDVCNEYKQRIYNCCLVNWYTPDHTIGLHSDNEAEMDNSWPILSVSWGGPRRFLLRPRQKKRYNNSKNNTKEVAEVHEFWLKDGDLLVMGGKCQEEFKHEVPKFRTTKDGVVEDRICWTLRKIRHKHKSNSNRTTTKVNGNGKRNNNDDDQNNMPRDRKLVIHNPYNTRIKQS